MSTVVLYCWCHSDGASVLSYFTFQNMTISAESFNHHVPHVNSEDVNLCIFFFQKVRLHAIMADSL